MISGGGAAVVAGAAVLGAVVGGAMVPLVRRSDVAPPPVVPVVATATVFAVCGWRAGGDWRLIAVLTLAAVLVAVSIVDIARYRIPDRILFPGLWVTAAVVVVGELVDGTTAALVRALVGALVFSGILFVMHLVSPGGMGFGDVKLALLLGLGCGWVAPDMARVVGNVFGALLVGSLGGVVIGGVLYLLRRLGLSVLTDPDEPDRLTTFPFGPPLAAGTLAIMLFAAA